MDEHFTRVYKDKSKEELEYIVSLHKTYDKRAIKVAVQLLKDKHGVLLPLPFKERIPYEKDELTLKNYANTFSIREITSALSLALLFNSVLVVLKYIKDAEVVDEHFSLILFLLLMVVFTLGHIFYRREHKRRNLLAGRIVQNLLTCLLIMLIMSLVNWIRDHEQPFSLENAFPLLFGFFMIVVCAEGIISIIRRTLLFFKWRIW